MTSCAACAQVLFRSVNKLLMDTATAEYLFCCDFFQEDAIFAELFAATLAVVEAALAASLQVAAPQHDAPTCTHAVRPVMIRLSGSLPTEEPMHATCACCLQCMHML